MNTNFKELLNIFNRHGVRFLIVGGYAVMKYSEPRFTKDLDIWVESSISNAERVYNALLEFGAPLDGLTEENFASGGFYQMGRPPLRIDILMDLDGVEFEECWENRQTSTLADVPVALIGRRELIKNKSATGRPQDLLDIENLNNPENEKEE